MTHSSAPYFLDGSRIGLSDERNVTNRVPLAQLSHSARVGRAKCGEDFHRAIGVGQAIGLASQDRGEAVAVSSDHLLVAQVFR